MPSDDSESEPAQARVNTGLRRAHLPVATSKVSITRHPSHGARWGGGGASQVGVPGAGPFPRSEQGARLVMAVKFKFRTAELPGPGPAQLVASSNYNNHWHHSRLPVCLNTAANTAALAGVCWLFCLNIPTLLCWVLGCCRPGPGPAQQPQLVASSGQGGAHRRCRLGPAGPLNGASSCATVTLPKGRHGRALSGSQWAGCAHPHGALKGHASALNATVCYFRAWFRQDSSCLLRLLVSPCALAVRRAGEDLFF